MKKFKTYVINLPSSKKRQEYMTDLLLSCGIFDVEFIEAIDGRQLSEEELRRKFDYGRCLKVMGREPNAGEVGCTLSHRKCYETLLVSDSEYAIVFEDDISFMRNPQELIDLNLDYLLATDSPRIIMLSGDYWFWTGGKIASVYDCNGAYAYIINKSAAKLLLSHPACGVADYWSLYKTYGLDLKAVRPYITDANLNMDILSSDVKQDVWSINRKRMTKGAALKSYINATMRRCLKYLGHFERKIPVMDNKIVVKKS